MGVNLNDTRVVGICDERVSVREPAGEGYTARRALDGECCDNPAGSRVSDFYGTVVVLVSDENVAVVEKFCAVGIAQLVRTVADDAVLSVLPDDGVV